MEDNGEPKSQEISEHISSSIDSLENDRSFQEMEISNAQNFFNLTLPEDVIQITREKPGALDSSVQSENSVISLNYLQSIENQYVHDILEDSKEDSFNIFANLQLDDNALANMKHVTRDDFSLDEKNLYATNFTLISDDIELSKKNRDFEEFLAIKGDAVATFELDSIKESSNANTGSTLSTTEYKQLHDEWHNKLVEFNSAIFYKNELIQQLTESLDQSVKERKEMLRQFEELKNEIAELQSKLAETEERKNAPNNIIFAETNETEKIESNLPEILAVEYLTLEKTLDTHQRNLLQELNLKFNNFLEETKEIYEIEMKKLKDKAVTEKEDFKSEIIRLKNIIDDFQSDSLRLIELKNELEIKHSQEMEELRTYFETKCADLEKNYSEEVFSQHSRKISSSSCSEAEMNSDLLPLHPAGSEGHDFLPNLNKKNIINLQNELNSIVNKISKCDLDNIKDEDFLNLKEEINQSNLKNLFKCDISALQNKHMNCEVKKDDQHDKIKNQYEEKLKDMTEKTEKYEKEIEFLKKRLGDQEKDFSVYSTVQEVASSGEFEIHEVIQSYERRLQEQVALAKLDIISALELQIQRLALNEVDDEEWPTELIKLRDKFTEKYEAQIKTLMQSHQNDIEKLKEENLKILNGALERTRRRNSRDEDFFNKEEFEIQEEMDILKCQVSSLRNLLGELVKYFSQCEDELNNTIVDELLKYGFDKNLSQTEDELNLSNSSPTSSSKTSDNALIVTRVHLIPNFDDLINIIENSSTEKDSSKDISINLKNELGVCLEKLKHEANAILALTNNITRQCNAESNDAKNTNLDEQVNLLTEKLSTEVQVKEELLTQLKEIQIYVETLERERDRLHEELERVVTKENLLEADLANAKCRISRFLEGRRKEILSEDHGEEGLQIQNLDLQKKARNLLSQTRTREVPSLLHLIEELCKVVEIIKEESKKDQFDLLKQIEAADKKYRTTQKFLEEQTMEREQERDEAQKRIDGLYNQLKERDKEKINYERIASEVERLELQLQEKNFALNAASTKMKEIESERNEAVEKIIVLRDIIRDLELQTEFKSKEIGQYLEAVKKLQCIIDQQDRISDTFVGGSTKDVSDVEVLYKHVDQLENEIQKLRLQAELAGNESVSKQFRTQLYEIESQVDRKTKDLETLHSTASTNCSSPSEDVSARELVLPKSPKKMEECEVPLQQLARLKEKLLRHSRAEDAAMKRTRDLEMQIYRLKQELEETTGERDYMKKQIQEQLVLISDFQIRLDEQRIRADNIEKQTNSSFELKLYDLQYEITSVREKLQQKEKIISNQQLLLTETQDRLKNLENELMTSKDDELIISMQKEIEKLRVDNARMKNKIQNDANMVPNLVENIISDKNTDMARLRLRLDETEKLLEEYSSLNLDKKDLQSLAKLKSDGTRLEELFSILDLSQADQVRRKERSERSATLDTPSIYIQKKGKDDTDLEPEISAIIGPGTSNSVDNHHRNSTEISSNKRVHFENLDVERLRREIDDLKELVEVKDKMIQDCNTKVEALENLETKIEKLQISLEDTEKCLAAAKETFEKEQQVLRDRENDLGVQLAEKKLRLEEERKQLEVLERDSRRKDEVYKNLVKEKKSLEKEITKLKHENYINVDNVIKEKNKEMEDLKDQLSAKFNSESERWRKQLSEKNEEIVTIQNRIDFLTVDLKSFQMKNETLEISLKENETEIKKLNKELENKMTQIQSLTTEMAAMKEKLNKKRKTIREIQDTIENQKKSLESMQEDHKQQSEIILDKNAVIDLLNENTDRYQTDIEALKKGDITQLKNQLEEKETKIAELNIERNHMLDLFNEKEKIINQMAEDSHQLHVNLMTIKSKIKEPGNIIDLGTKLRDEQRKTAELLQEVHILKAQLMHYKNNDVTVDEIADQLKREFDYSNRIDCSILSAISDQSSNSISETQDVEDYKKEKNNKKQLILHAHKLKSKIMTLEEDLEKERADLLRTRTEDAKYIEQLRIQLDACLESEAAVKKILVDKCADNEKLENELNYLRTKYIQNSKSESTQYKQLPSKESSELNKLRQDYEILLDVKNQLYNEFSSLKRYHLETEAGYKCTKDLLALEVQKKNSYEEKIQSLLSREKKLEHNLMQKNLEMEQAMGDLSQQKAELLKQKLELSERTKSQNPFKVQPPLPSAVTFIPDEFLDKIKELNITSIDNKNFMDLIMRLSNEKKQLEIELDVAKRSNKNINIQYTNDLVARADFLFAKTLKLESVKKALIFQKRYLMHQNTFSCVLSDPVIQRREFKLMFTLKHRFRAAAFVIISLIRMKYLVRRWHSGVRIGEKINTLHYKNSSSTQIESNILPVPSLPAASAHFQVGQPVSNQFFSNLPTSNINPLIKDDKIVDDTRNFPWSGNTPPSKERQIIRPNTLINKEDVTPLRAPQLFAQFVERFDQIQEKISCVLESNS